MVDPAKFIKLRKRLNRYISRDTYFTNFRSCRPVKNLTTGEIFPSMKQAANVYGVSTASIRAAINKPTRTCAHCKWTGLGDSFSNEKTNNTDW